MVLITIQTWGWLDTYDRNDKLYDKYFLKNGKGFNIEILNNDELSSFGTTYFLSKIENCLVRSQNSYLSHPANKI